jgi:putative transposase
MSDKIIHGVKIKLHPNERQRKQFDDWRIKSRKLWNLLLGMQRAAYDGSKHAPELRWRKIWKEVEQEIYQIKLDVYLNGRIRKDGTVKKEAGKGKEPQPITDEYLRKVSGGKVNGHPPKIFIWKDALMRLMARLKQEPLTSWIGDLHSHAAQRICREMTDALKDMKKLDRGFPRFKKGSYASGTVYFANTQLKFDWRTRENKGKRRGHKIKFPNGVGWVNCGALRADQFEDGIFWGARIYREGEQWWISAQFKIDTPKAPHPTDKECGVKIAASTVYTITPNNTTTEEEAIQIKPRKYSVRDNVLFARSSRRASRRKRGTADYYEAQAELAAKYAQERNRRDDILHKGSRKIVNQFERIAIDTMDIKSLMDKKKSKKRRENTRKRLAAAGIKMPNIDPKMLRKLNRNAAMHKAKLFVQYKAAEAGRILEECDQFKPVTQICSKCEKVHIEMKTLKKNMVCTCGNRLDRRVNAAIVVRDDVEPY